MDLRDKKKLKKIDQTVGQNIKRFRTARNMSQQSLAEQIGVTFQQIQKYENGTNRVSASRLYALCQIFGFPIECIFDGISCQGKNRANKLPSSEVIILAIKIESLSKRHGVPGSELVEKLGALTVSLLR